MKLSEIAAIVEEVSEFPLVGIRQDDHYIIVDIGFIGGNKHPSPIIPFILSTLQLGDPVDGPEFVRILTREACEKLKRFLPEVAVHK